MQRELSFEDISAVFEYEPLRGVMYRRFKNKGLREVNLVCEVVDRSWLRSTQVLCKGHMIIATHIIFMLMTQRWPKEGMVIDHIDGNVSNNKWHNLRECTVTQNNCNRESNGRWNDRELNMEMGVRLNGAGNFEFRINGTHLGTFHTLEKANAFAIQKRKEIHGEFVRKRVRRI